MTKVTFDAPLTPDEDKNVRNIARVARMLKVRKDSPHAETSTYDSSIWDYKYLWHKLSQEARDKAKEHALRISDLTVEDIDAALVELGG